jgi:hypothetical protein
MIFPDLVIVAISGRTQEKKETMENMRGGKKERKRELRKEKIGMKKLM